MRGFRPPVAYPESAASSTLKGAPQPKPQAEREGYGDAGAEGQIHLEVVRFELDVPRQASKIHLPEEPDQRPQGRDAHAYQYQCATELLHVSLEWGLFQRCRLNG